jgi:hypothetical protein
MGELRNVNKDSSQKPEGKFGDLGVDARIISSCIINK